MTPAPSIVDALKIDPLEVPTNFGMLVPVTTYINELTNDVALLREHKGIYLELLGVEVEELALEIEKQMPITLNAEIKWKEEAKSLDVEAHFWFDNKDQLWKLDRELTARFGFLFKKTKNYAALAILTDIGTTDNDDDAVSDGLKHCQIIKDNSAQITEKLYSVEQLKVITDFLTHIQKARAASKVDRSAPNYARIERDRQYIALQKLEEQVIELADAAFVNDPKERRRYVSEYLRTKRARADKKRLEKETAEKEINQL